MSRSFQYGVILIFVLAAPVAAIGVGMRLGSDPTLPLVLLGLVVGIGLLLAQRGLDRRRSARLRRTALGLGLRFEATGERVEGESSLALPLLGRGAWREIRNVMWSPGDEPPLLLFDFAYREGPRGALVGQTCAALHCPAGGLPEFQLEPERWVHDLMELAGFGDIDFETHPVFSKRYRVQGKDEDAIREVFQRGVLDRLAGDPGWSIGSNGEWVLLYREDERVAPAELARFRADSRTLAGLLCAGSAAAW